MTSWRSLVPLLMLGVLGVLLWLGLNRPPPRATWLTLEVARMAIMGKPYRIRVTLPQAVPAPADGELKLVVDVRWRNARYQDRGGLATTDARVIAPTGQPMDFAVPIPAQPGLATISFNIYLTPTGRWVDRVRSAQAGDIRVLPTGSTGADIRLVELRPTPIVNDPGGVPEEPLPARFAIAGSWILFSILWGRWRGNDRGGRSLVIATAAAAAWELLPFEAWLGLHARAFAVAHGWYELRGPLQKVLTVAIVLGAAALVTAFWRHTRDRALRLAGCGFLAYVALTIVSFLSQHAVDAWLGLRLLDATVLQLLQLTAVFVAIAGAAVTRR